MAEHPPDGPTAHRFGIAHLRDDQVALLQAVLRAGDVPVVVHRDEVLTAAAHATDVATALAWVMAEDDDPAVATEPVGSSDGDTEGTPSTRRGPLVAPSRPPLADGRRQATRYRRLAAGLLDELLVGIPTLTATAAGAAPWTVAVIHGVYHVAPTSLYGWSIGKLWCGLRTADARTLRHPEPVRAVTRWSVAYLPVLASLFLGLPGDLAALGVIAVYAPILVDLRGLHDRAAGTLVVERSAAGISGRRSGRRRRPASRRP